MGEEDTMKKEEREILANIQKGLDDFVKNWKPTKAQLAHYEKFTRWENEQKRRAEERGETWSLEDYMEKHNTNEYDDEE